MPFTLPQQKRTLGGAPYQGSTGGTSGTGAPPAAPAGQRASPGYVGFSRLLAVNQGGAQRMADKLASGVQQQGSKVASTMETNKADFERKTQDATQRYTKPEYHWGGINAKVPGTQEKDPESAALYRTAGAAKAASERQFSGAKDWEEAGYNPSALMEEATKAQADAKGLTTAGGRGAMIRRDVTGPYGAGMSSLDAALSGAALGSRGRDLASLYGGLSQKLTDYRAAGDEAVSKATDISNEAAAKYGADAEKYTAWAEQRAKEEEREREIAMEIRRRRYGALPVRLTDMPGDMPAADVGNLFGWYGG